MVFKFIIKILLLCVIKLFILFSHIKVCRLFLIFFIETSRYFCGNSNKQIYINFFNRNLSGTVWATKEEIEQKFFKGDKLNDTNVSFNIYNILLIYLKGIENKLIKEDILINTNVSFNFDNFLFILKK